jgi:hypothetical protein
MALEQETNAIFRILTERTIGESETYRLEALMGSDIPSGVKTFFKAELRRKVEGDLRKSPWFTGVRQNDAAAARVAQTLISSLTDAYRFTRQEFLDTLDLAVHFVTNYLCRPQWTLENFLFDRAPRITLAELAEGLTFFADFRYLGEIALRSLQRRGKNEIGREEFQALVQNIDEHVVRQHDARELADLTRPLFTFFQIGGTQADGAIPVEALLVFFEDKRLQLLKEYVRGICHLRNRTHVTREELMNLIEDLFAGKPGTSTDPSSLPAEQPPAPSASNPEPVPAEPEAPAPPAPERPAPAAGGQQKANIALSLTFAGLRESVVARSALPELHTLIHPEQRDRFVTNIFKGDAAHFAGALDRLDSCRHWRDAEAYLGELYRTYNLDPHAGDAKEFSDTVRKRYSINERVS